MSTQDLQLIAKIKESIETCQTIYGDQRPQIKANHKAEIEEHHKINKTKNLLSSAIVLSMGKSMEKGMIYISSAF